MVIVKVASILSMFYLAYCVSNLYRVFRGMPDITERDKEDRGYVAIGISVEVILIVIISIKVITG